MLLFAQTVKADDGYRLWLRYEGMQTRTVAVHGRSATFDAIRDELRNAGLTQTEGAKPSIVIGCPETSTFISRLNWQADLKRLGPEGYRIRTVNNVVVIASTTDVGALYGAFHFLRLLQTEQPIDRLRIDEKPALQRRLLNHWDNLDGSIERGYAGKSLWNWDELPEKIDPRLRDYARANASIGINGAVLNNVNASSEFLTPKYLAKVAAIAGVFRPYGVRVYLSARFSAPMELGKLPTADPFDAAVIAWWKQKADEIYKVIPDFGGFTVKANSEGQPGPRTYGRNHVDGANMLAAAVAPHNGIVMWRAFVYDMKPGYDRAGAAYENL
ncbi:MAG TPA: alpha-glucuronidase family glycosyl hydrolase, partial [Pyrinomonadaceae bacterium]|nr:alpha-glucuronidase family glycosyl hydrolase [Pyrinomonadaceae bacterium]